MFGLMSDPYDHPDGVECIYIATSMYHDDEVYTVTCGCDGDTQCVSSSCACVSTSGVNYAEGKLVEDKLNDRGSSVFECNETCRCDERCGNRESQRGPSRDLEIVLSGAKGYGVFARRPIPRGSYVCEYAGEVSSTEIRDGTSDWRYVITLNETSADGSTTNTFIDASKFGNVGRYLNHSCDPNCVLVPVRYDNVAPKVGIFASRNIREGEELCYIYAQHDGDLSDTPCLCGSDTCKKFLPLGCFKGS
uniref:Histone-lysine N-methyltransferase SETMAR n=1 Tax=Lygus hesperus TaxID=30085 RepID=A0A146L384_LYGHE